MFCAGCCSVAKTMGPTRAKQIKSVLHYGGTLSTTKNYNARSLYRRYPIQGTVRGTFIIRGGFASLTTVLGLESDRNEAARYGTCISNRCVRVRSHSYVIVAIRSVAQLGRIRTRLGLTHRGTRGTSHSGSIFLTGVDRRVHAPLGTVIKFSRLLTSTSASRRGARFLRVIRDGGRVLRRLVTSVLSLSGVRTKALRFIFSSISVGRVVSSLRRRFHVQITRLNDKIRVIQRTSRGRCAVRASEGQLTRIMSGFVAGTLGFARRNDVALKFEPCRRNLCFCMGSAKANVPRRGLPRIFRHFIGLGRRGGNAKLKLSVYRAVIHGLKNRVNIRSRRKTNSAF